MSVSFIISCVILISVCVVLSIKIILTHYTAVQLSIVLDEFGKTLDDIQKLDFDSFSKEDAQLVSRVMCYDQSLYNHKFYGTMFDYIAYRDILANIKLSLVDILPNGRVLYRNETINDILK